MDNTWLTTVVVLLTIACSNFGNLNSSSTNSVFKYDKMLHSTVMGVTIPLEQSSKHVREGQHIDYLSIPPTSGRHWSSWADCGFYTQSLPDERIVDNLEHGHVVISYNLANPAKVTALRDSLESMALFQVWGVAHPYDEIEEGRIVLIAWGRTHS